MNDKSEPELITIASDRAAEAGARLLAVWRRIEDAAPGAGIELEEPLW